MSSMTAESCWRRPVSLVIALENSVERSETDSSTTGSTTAGAATTGADTTGADTTGAGATGSVTLGTDFDLAGGIIHYIVVVI